MIEAKIDSTDLDQLLKKLSDSPGVVKAARQKAFEDAAPKLKQALDAAIGGTGKVQSWQEQSVGSRGGYAAVRPKKQTYTQTNGKGKRYAVGYVTNAINTGIDSRCPRVRRAISRASGAAGRMCRGCNFMSGLRPRCQPLPRMRRSRWPKH